MKTNNLILALLLVAGCGGKAAPADDFSDFSLDLKSDSFTSKSKFLGNFSSGQKIPLVQYTKTPRYRMLGLMAQAGLTADIRVHSTTGDDPVAYLLDYTKKVIASNDDADATTTDSHIKLTLPASNGFYYLVVREYYGHKATFQIAYDTHYPTNGAGSAQQAYDLASTHLVDFVIDPSALPKKAKTKLDEYTAKFSNATPAAYDLPTDALGDIFVVADNQEEIYWVDLYDSTGKLVTHGASGDGGPEITFWGAPYQSWDPSVQ